ncbi:MAG: SGNH hydrolase domain-containing protein [Pseudomonadota bacterium]
MLSKKRPLPSIEMRTPDRRKRSVHAKDVNCDQYTADVLDRVTALPSVETVIIWGRWALATEGTRAPNELGDDAQLAVRGQDVSGIADNEALVRAGLDQLVQALRNAGVEVILLGGTPEIGRIVPDVVLAYGTDIPSDAIPTRADIIQRNARADAILNEVATRHDVTLISARDTLCPDQCVIQRDGRAVYRDDDHLSGTGAKWAIGQIMSGTTQP